MERTEENNDSYRDFPVSLETSELCQVRERKIDKNEKERHTESVRACSMDRAMVDVLLGVAT